MPSIFSRIISSELPSYKIYEDDFVVAFLNIHPHAPGHTLIVPKVEIDHFADVPEGYYEAIFSAAKKLSPALKQATNCVRVCAMFSGFDIPHCHYHLVPALGPDDLSFSHARPASPENLENMQKNILEFLHH